jgi:DegV family protein with EDD domain
MSIRIFTDSAADLEPSEFADYHIGLIPLSITVDQRVYQADLQFNKQDFFRMLEATPIFPTTSQPAPADFEEIFEEARQKGDEILYISISSALSGTFQCASVVKEMGGYDNVYLVDSLSATLGMKLLVLHAAWLRDRGFPTAEIAARVEKLRSRVRLYAGLDTLEYLQKGGRLSKAAAGLGTLARVKPVVTLSQAGTVQVAGKCLGKGKAMSQISTLMAETPPDTRFPVYGIYSSQDNNLQELEEKLAHKGQSVSAEFGIGPVIGAHIGPGAYGVVYIAKED